jgi:Tol biopolymer transport system component
MLPGLAISPDGRQLAFAQWDALKVMPAAGGEPRIFHRLQDKKMFALIHTGTGLSWTPDGRYVLFETRNLGHLEPTELWRVPAEGGEAQKLLEMDGLTDINVHPDGQHIAFTVGSTQLEVWAMENFLTLD